MNRVLYILIIFLLSTQMGYAQDSQFTQFYAAPTYLNPAFAGTSVQHRLSANYRNQWPSIPGKFVIYNVAYDRYEPDINSGFGILVNREQAGSGALANTTASLQYAYEARIKRDVFFRPALQFTYVHRSINFGELLFTDQMIRDGDEPSLEENILEPVNFFDISAGGLLTTKKLWLGFSAHHLNQPDESLYDDNFSFLPRKYSFHAGYRKKFKSQFGRNKSSVVLATNYKMQADFDQLDLGLYWEIIPMVVGLWYRSVPFKSNGYGHANHDAINIIVGYHAGRYKIGYSYDITISQLSLGSSGGAHELSIIYEWANRRNKNLSKRRIIPCAKF